MSNKPFDNATPELMREELVQQHDLKSLEFALMVTGHVGGPPQTSARIITELVERNPAFAAFFLLSFLQRMRGRQGVEDGTPPNGSAH